MLSYFARRVAVRHRPRCLLRRGFLRLIGFHMRTRCCARVRTRGAVCVWGVAVVVVGGSGWRWCWCLCWCLCWCWWGVVSHGRYLAMANEAWIALLYFAWQPYPLRSAAFGGRCGINWNLLHGCEKLIMIAVMAVVAFYPAGEDEDCEPIPEAVTWALIVLALVPVLVTLVLLAGEGAVFLHRMCVEHHAGTGAAASGKGNVLSDHHHDVPLGSKRNSPRVRPLPSTRRASRSRGGDLVPPPARTSVAPARLQGRKRYYVSGADRDREQRSGGAAAPPDRRFIAPCNRTGSSSG